MWGVAHGDLRVGTGVGGGSVLGTRPHVKHIF